MKRIIVLLVIVTICCAAVFGSNNKRLNSISIGIGYGMHNSFGENNDTLIHGPGISFSGISTLVYPNVVLVADGVIGFPISLSSGGYEVRRKDFKFLMSIDTLLGIAYMTRLRSSPIWTYVGGGFYFSEFSATIEHMTTLDFLLGVGLIAGSQIYFTENVFLNISIRPAITFIDFRLVRTSNNAQWNAMDHFGTAVSSKVAIGYNF